MLKARCYELVGDLKGALEIYTSQRDDPDALFRAAKIYVGRREFDKGTASLESLFKLNDSHVDGLKLKSSMLESLGEIEAALQLSDKVSSIFPDEAETLWRRIDLLKRLGKIDQTVQLYDHIVSLDPSDSKARAERIEILKSLGRGDRLVAEYDAMLRSDPNDIGALIGKGSLLVDSSRAGPGCGDGVLQEGTIG